MFATIEYLYKNVQEYISEAVRIQNLQRITTLAAGSMPNAHKVTRADQEAAARALFEEKGRDYDAFTKK